MAYPDSIDNEGAAETVALPTGEVSHYIALLKPRVMSLVVFTGFVGLMMAPGGINPVLGFAAILAIAVGSGAAGALNMWFDADIDRLMSRTAMRPIPAGRVSRGEALGLGLILSIASVVVLELVTNWVAAALLAFTILFYVVVYTMWLKRSTPQNIVIGGIAGAMPPLIGWAAVTGSVSMEGFVLFAIIFLWTPPHFWALSLYRSDDYRRAGIPMLPVAAGEASTKRHILGYAVILALVAPLPAFMGMAGPVYGMLAVALGALFVWLSWCVNRMPEADREMRPARRLFGFSLLYLFLIFAGLLVEQGVGRIVL